MIVVVTVMRIIMMMMLAQEQVRFLTKHLRWLCLWTHVFLVDPCWLQMMVVMVVRIIMRMWIRIVMILTQEQVRLLKKH